MRSAPVVTTLAACLAFTIFVQGAEPARPALTDEPPAPGKFVRQVAAEYTGSGVYHGLYLPTNWQAGQMYPVVVEYAPNRAEAFGTTGRVEDCRLGYYWTAGQDFIWLVLPYVDTESRTNRDNWWGDADVTVDYALTNIARVCDQFGGQRDTIVLCGFSRGAIACGYLGLRNDTIADVWLAFWAHSHIDGGRFTPTGGAERLTRTRGRATLVTWGETDNAKDESPRGAQRLRESQQPVTEIEIPAQGHTDRWIEHDSAAREKIRRWLDETVQQRPGTFRVRGQVVDPAGQAIAGARVECGGWHRAVTDATGRYELRGLTSGSRPLVAKHERFTTSAPRTIVIVNEDISTAEIVLTP